MAERPLYLFDGWNILHAGGFADARELRDTLASFVAVHGARGILVFDGAGTDETVGELDVRWTPNADTLLERLAAENRGSGDVVLVSSDEAVRSTSGVEVAKVRSAAFARDLADEALSVDGPRGLADHLDASTLERLERLRVAAPSAGAALGRFRDALNAHDVDAVVACFDPGCEIEYPGAPASGFHGHEPLRRRWTTIFRDVPDFHAELLRLTARGDEEWGEWRWGGTRPGGAALVIAGVTIVGVHDGRIAWGRFHLR